MGGTKRLFADDYSGTGQSDWKLGKRGTGGETWDSDFLGQLRFDSLTSETLVIPDSHIFDGPYFIGVSPTELLKKLGRCAPDDDPVASAVLPIELRTRRATLSESLAELLRRERSSVLNHRAFKTIEDEDLRDAVARTLGSTPAERLDRALASAPDPAQAVMRVLRESFNDLGVADRADAVLGPIEQGWRTWLELESRLDVRQWPPDRPFRLADALAIEELPDVRLLTPMGAEAHRLTQEHVALGSRYRGDVWRDLVQLRQDANGDDDALAEVEMVERWYSRGRYRAIAWQHQSACVQVDRPWLEPLSALQALYREALDRPEGNHVEVPDGVISALGDMDAEAFRRLTFTYRRELAAWWREGDVDGLRLTAAALADEVKLAPPRRNPVGLSELVGAAGPVGGAAAGAAVGGPVGAVVGALIGAVGVVAAGHLRTPTERDRVRDRILEAWTYRGGSK